MDIEYGLPMRRSEMEKPKDCEEIDFEHKWKYTAAGADKFASDMRTCRNCGKKEIHEWRPFVKPIP